MIKRKYFLETLKKIVIYITILYLLYFITIKLFFNLNIEGYTSCTQASTCEKCNSAYIDSLGSKDPDTGKSRCYWDNSTGKNGNITGCVTNFNSLSDNNCKSLPSPTRRRQCTFIPK